MRLYPGYKLNPIDMTIIPGPTTPVVNLRELTELLRSKDETAWEKSKWVFEGQLFFLDGQPNKSNKVALASFPRSGNTFLRKYCEMLTGIHTGSDFNIETDMAL